MSDDDPEPGLVKEEVTLPDGRYLIFYSFTDKENADGPSAA